LVVTGNGSTATHTILASVIFGTVIIIRASCVVCNWNFFAFQVFAFKLVALLWFPVAVCIFFALLLFGAIIVRDFAIIVRGCAVIVRGCAVIVIRGCTVIVRGCAVIIIRGCAVIVRGCTIVLSLGVTGGL
jgi:hypothetical protein